MEKEVIVIRKGWTIDLLVGSGFTPMTGVRTKYFSFLAQEGQKKVELLFDFSGNTEAEYLDFEKHRDGFKYLSLFDMDGNITKDLFTFVKEITKLELKDLEFHLDVKLKDGSHLKCPADLIYQNELFICKKGIRPSVLKD